ELDPRVQDHQRHGHVGGMDGDARVARAQDRVDPVHATDGRAVGPGVPFVAVRGRVVEVRAAGALQQVAADRGVVAELTRGAREQRLGKYGVARPYPGVGGRVRVGRLRPDPEPTVRQLVDVRQGQPADVDQVGRLLDFELHQVQQVGATADELRA